jgi:hypothetical protein
MSTSPSSVPAQFPSESDLAQRRWTRFPADRPTVVLRLAEGREFEARVRDESFGGIAVLLPAPAGAAVFAPGLTVDVVYGGPPMKALVKRIQELPEGKLLVGLEWA